MQWYFEIPGNLAYIETEEPKDTGRPPDYDHYFRSSIHDAARENGTRVWVRENGKNILVWECRPQPGASNALNTEEGEFLQLTNTIEHHEFALKLLSAAWPLWEPVIGKSPVLQRTVDVQTAWIAGAASERQRDAAMAKCYQAAERYPEGVLRSYHEAVLWLCSPYRKSLVDASLENIFQLADVDLALLQERAWAEIFSELLKAQETLSEEQAIALRCLEQVLESIETARPSRQFTGIWQTGASEPANEADAYVFPLVRGYYPNLFFSTRGRTELVCGVERIAHELRYRTLQMVLDLWTAPSENRTEVAKAIAAYRQWISGELSDKAFNATTKRLAAHVPAVDLDDADSEDQEDQPEEELQDSQPRSSELELPGFLTRVVSELRNNLESFPVLYQLALCELHTYIIEERTEQAQPTGEASSHVASIERALTEWLVQELSQAIHSSPASPVVRKAALRQLEMELEHIGGQN